MQNRLMADSDYGQWGWGVCDYKQHKGDLGGDGIGLCLDCDGGYMNLYMR